MTLFGKENENKSEIEKIIIKSQTKETKNIVSEVLVINNQTEKKYLYETSNEFGLVFEYESTYIRIRQTISPGEHETIAVLYNFSILSITRKTI